MAKTYSFDNGGSTCEDCNSGLCGSVNGPNVFAENEEVTCLNNCHEKHFCTERVYNGTVTKSDFSWPWQVYLPQAGCGGSLLSSDTILTAAHCIISRSGRTKSLQGTLVVAGGQSLTSDNRQLRRIKTMIPHPSYSYHSQQNDLAIIKVFPISFTINSYVRPVCLPCHATELPDKTKCIVTGFGMTGYSRSSEEKIYASVETHTREYCQSQFGRSFQHGKALVEDSG